MKKKSVRPPKKITSGCFCWLFSKETNCFPSFQSLNLFKVFFYGLYHDKSPSCPPFGRRCLGHLFYSHRFFQANPRKVMIILPILFHVQFTKRLPWVHPGRLTWTIIIEVRKIIFPSKWVICRFLPLNLPGSSRIGGFLVAFGTHHIFLKDVGGGNFSRPGYAKVI